MTKVFSLDVRAAVGEDEREQVDRKPYHEVLWFFYLLSPAGQMAAVQEGRDGSKVQKFPFELPVSRKNAETRKELLGVASVTQTGFVYVAVAYQPCAEPMSISAPDSEKPVCLGYDVDVAELESYHEKLRAYLTNRTEDDSDLPRGIPAPPRCLEDGPQVRMGRILWDKIPTVRELLDVAKKQVVARRDPAAAKVESQKIIDEFKASIAPLLEKVEAERKRRFHEMVETSWREAEAILAKYTVEDAKWCASIAAAVEELEGQKAAGEAMHSLQYLDRDVEHSRSNRRVQEQLANEKKAWIEQHGSERLRLAAKHGIEHSAIYLEERVNAAFGGANQWQVARLPREILVETPRNPPVEALIEFDRQRTLHPDCGIELLHVVVREPRKVYENWVTTMRGYILRAFIPGVISERAIRSVWFDRDGKAHPVLDGVPRVPTQTT